MDRRVICNSTLSQVFSKHNLLRPRMKTHGAIVNFLLGTAPLHDDFNRRHEDVILPFAVSRIDSKLGEELREVQQNIVEMMKGVTA